MNNQFVGCFQSREDKSSNSADSGLLVKRFKQENDESNDSNQLNDKDIIILNDNDFNLVPTSSEELVNYNLIDKIEPITNPQNAATTRANKNIASIQTTTTELPTAINQTTNNQIPLITINNNSNQPLFTLPSNPLVPISTTHTTNEQNQTITTTNYEIVDTIANPVSIPDVDGNNTLFGGVFSGIAASFSDEQMQQLLDASAISVTDGVEVLGSEQTHAGVGQQIEPSLQVCNPPPQTMHQPFKDITNTVQNGLIPLHAVQTPSKSSNSLPFALQPPRNMPNGFSTPISSSAASTAAGLSCSGLDGPMGVGGMGDMNLGDSMQDYSMFIKSEGLSSLDDLDVPHFIKHRYIDGKQAKIWQCGVCEKEFGHQYILMRHLPTHTDERKFQCTVCGKAFRQMSTLSQHRAIHSADRPYICEICDKTFNRVSTLISHRKTHTGLKPHQCHLCNKAFHQKGNLRNHIFTHTNERPYKCDVCQKGFNQMSNLMCHKLKAHQRADKPKYNCQTCGKEFQKRMGLRNHEQYEHGDNGGSTGNPAQKIKYTNGVLIDRISTAAMQLAIDTNEIPFALLRPLNGIPVLVRALPAGEKQLLVPATADDLKRHGHITIGGKPNIFRLNEDNGLKSDGNIVDVKSTDSDSKENKNSKVQIRIPVVATVVQRMDKDGVMRMDVESPGPTPTENYSPREINLGSSKPLTQSDNDNISKNDDIVIETTSLQKRKSFNLISPVEDNMDVEPSTSSNRIIERYLPAVTEKIHQANGDSGISGYFDLTNGEDEPEVGEKSSGNMAQFDSGVFSSVDDADPNYCEMFEILRKDDNITAVDLTGDDNSIRF